MEIRFLDQKIEIEIFEEGCRNFDLKFLKEEKTYGRKRIFRQEDFSSIERIVNLHKLFLQ